jgi:hypothetical protein
MRPKLDSLQYPENLKYLIFKVQENWHFSGYD